MRHGLGTYEWANGNTYAGEWHQDMMHGLGASHNYAGQYLDHIAHGLGVLLPITGGQYAGEFQRGQTHGFGTFSNPSFPYAAINWVLKQLPGGWTLDKQGEWHNGTIIHRRDDRLDFFDLQLTPYSLVVPPVTLFKAKRYAKAAWPIAEAGRTMAKQARKWIQAQKELAQHDAVNGNGDGEEEGEEADRHWSQSDT